MATAPRNLFDAAVARGRIVRQGEIACIIMDGAGAMIVWMQELMQAQKWAQSRQPSSNLLTDRARFLDQFGTLISRPGSVQSTRGNDRQLEKLAKAMLAAGYDIKEWTLPTELRELGHAPPPPTGKAASSPASADDAETPSQPPPPDIAGS